MTHPARLDTNQYSERGPDVTKQWIEDVAMGGAVLGSGGGGARRDGIEFGHLAVEYGSPTVVPLSELDDDAVVVTVSAVGAPAAEDQCVEPSDYVRAVELVRDTLEDRGRGIGGLMTNEMGGFASVNGLVQSAVTGVPVVDAACNGRAHPTGPMGSMGLPVDSHHLQAGVGGDPTAGRYVELTVEATLETAADAIRRAAEDAGGLVAVARNPVPADYARDCAAVEVYEQARTLGTAVLEAEDGMTAGDRVAEVLNGEVIVTDEVDAIELRTEGGFDVGEVHVGSAELTFWNEYMTLERQGERVATFPDVITTLDSETGTPVSTADIETGQQVSVVTAPASELRLGAGMRDPELFEPVEDTLGKSIIDDVFAEQPP